MKKKMHIERGRKYIHQYDDGIIILIYHLKLRYRSFVSYVPTERLIRGKREKKEKELAERAMTLFHSTLVDFFLLILVLPVLSKNRWRLAYRRGIINPR